MSASIQVSFIDAAVRYNKPRMCALPADMTVAQLQKIMAGADAKKNPRFAFTLADGCAPSGGATLADLFSICGDVERDMLTITVVEEGLLGAGLDCCIKSAIESRKQEATDYYTHILAQQLSR